MDWTQFTTFLFANIAFTLTLWLWARTESKSDQRQMLGVILSIQEEIKDFHGRLCAIEAKRNEK